MFFFQKLLDQGLAGIDGTALVPTIITIAYTILLIGFLVSLYQAALRGGDVQSLGMAAIKYVIVAIILANWSTVFHEINHSFNQLAEFIANSSGAGDMFSSWMAQLKQQFQNDTVNSLWKLILGSPAALITALLIILAYLVFAVAVVVFGFFYTLYGCVLYVAGPLVLALLPIAGTGELAANFATNFFIWNSWAILYALFGDLITAIHVNDINSIFSNGFGGFFVGAVDSVILGIVSIFYAVALLLIPKIAKSIVSGDVGLTMNALLRAGAVAVGTVISIAAGAAVGSAAGSSSSSGAGASSSASGGTGLASGTSSGGSGTASSSSPPPQPSLGRTIRSGIQSAVGGEAPTSSSNGSGGSSSSASAQNGSPQAPRSSSANWGPQPFHRGSVVQIAAFHAARLTSQMAHKAAATVNGDDDKEDQP
ncbi:MAG TPA: hypothetical protein VFP59_11760 [Candidatus Angelobacter sp.]|nr:hypothetical protein [Candidatus Angelobacter sp.]